MKKDLLCVHEYRTPVCKVVTFSLGSSCLQVTSPYGDAGFAGANSTVEYDGTEY